MYILCFSEEEYKRLTESLADEGTYTAVGYRYSADYYDPSQPTEEEEANREAGESAWTHTCTQMAIHTRHGEFLPLKSGSINWRDMGLCSGDLEGGKCEDMRGGIVVTGGGGEEDDKGRRDVTAEPPMSA